jgi:hypothetical protein
MEKMLKSGSDFVISSGYVYAPLLVDSEIDEALKADFARKSTIPKFRNLKSLARTDERMNQVDENLLEYDGISYIKTTSLQSLVESYDKIHPALYDGLKKKCLEKYMPKSLHVNLDLDPYLEEIVFKVMPFFISKNKGLERKKFTEDEICRLVIEHEKIPADYVDKSEQFSDTKDLADTIKRLESNQASIDLPSDGKISAKSLRNWVYKALDAKIILEEKETMKGQLKEHQDLMEKNRNYIATLLYLKDKNELEIDGFGFFKDKKNKVNSGGYWVYVHTGEYALKDFNGKLYLFGDCRVGVNTNQLDVPHVIDQYSHPFLRDYRMSYQSICIKDRNLSNTFSAGNLIRSLQTGLNTILYGYVKSEGFHPYHRFEMDEFKSHLVTRNHPKIKSGEVEIKNDFI